MTTTKPSFNNKSQSAASQFTPVELTPEQKQAWTTTRGRVIASAPAFSHILYTMMSVNTGKDLAIFTKDVPIAATDGVNLVLNPDTFFAMPLPERVFVVVHEILHCVFDHIGQSHNFKRRGKVAYPDGKQFDYHPELMNVATDLVINDLLIESKIGSFPKVGMHDTSVATHKDLALDVYRKLYEEAQKNGGKGKGRGQGFDVHLQPGQGTGQNPDQAQGQRNDAEWKTQMAAGIAAAKAQGNMPAAIERMFNDLLNPQVDWREHIKALFARKVGTGSYDWRRPERRAQDRDQPLYAPSRAGNGAGTIIVGVDTSGSIGPKILDMFFAEMAGILEDLQPQRIVIMWCDAKVGRVDEVEEAGDLNVVRGKGAPGGGGTRFEPVFTEAGKLGLEPDALVYLTDGYGSFPQAAPSYPVIWGSIACKAEHYPFGDVVMIEERPQ
jgi:predicted metal-dependent peptidase